MSEEEEEEEEGREKETLSSAPPSSQGWLREASACHKFSKVSALETQGTHKEHTRNT